MRANCQEIAGQQSGKTNSSGELNAPYPGCMVQMSQAVVPPINRLGPTPRRCGDVTTWGVRDGPRRPGDPSEIETPQRGRSRNQSRQTAGAQDAGCLRAHTDKRQPLILLRNSDPDERVQAGRANEQQTVEIDRQIPVRIDGGRSLEQTRGGTGVQFTNDGEHASGAIDANEQPRLSER
jgi:hypothetical protein